MELKETILKVALFSLAFAFVEAAVVVYLRHLTFFNTGQFSIGSDEILFSVPGIAFLKADAALRIIQNDLILTTEMTREGATMVMLLCIALLAGRKVSERVAYFFLAFGVWDIFYYVFLKLAIDWPKTLTDLDIFFLLPIPWVGSVFVPIIISTFLILLSTHYLIKNANSLNS